MVSVLNSTSFVCKEDNQKLHEECGVFGICAPNEEIDPAVACYNGLLALQHRGQEGCGIAVNNDGVLSYSKDMGLVTDVFNAECIGKLKGQMGVGHVRYSNSLCKGFHCHCLQRRVDQCL